ncbi:glycosyltransferase family 2 protein [Salinibacterium sp. dk2585]|nr:glycosyltransferase family 2 protein [Salinibacterium sp. dk2585]TXK56087.1 glycosyltransferase family 2 protein [Salinibacterium sp. dk5596]
MTVAVLTYRRPDDLAELLPQLCEQAEASRDDVKVLVVDNDALAGARELCEQFAPRSVHYLHEPTPGISSARNRALDASVGDDVLVYIDDDERPLDGWLESMLVLYRERRPAGVVGPVISRFDGEPEPFVAAGRFFDRRRLPTGTAVDVAATNNLLLDLRQVGALRFDPEFGLSGGSDTLFTRQLVARGGQLLWCDEAIVVDVVPAARLTRSWVLRRAFRSGNSWSRTSIRLARTPLHRALTRLDLSSRGLARVISGAGLRAIGALTRTGHLQAKGLRRLQRGGGMLTGAWGHVYSEYGR